MFNVSEQIENDSIEAIMHLTKEFQLKQLTFVEPLRQNQVTILKKFSSNDFMIKTKDNYDQIFAHDTLIANLKEDYMEVFKEEGANFKKGLMIFQDSLSLEKAASKLNLEINQEIYLLDLSSLVMYETYEINKVRTTKKLGYVSKINDSFAWIWEPNVDPR